MPVTPTYPGIYIQEILSTSHSVTAAPTSVTVFIGYPHPFKAKEEHYGQAVEIFSPQEYDREFGGSVSVGWLSDDLAQAVYQFFLNGGADAIIVAVRPGLYPLATGVRQELNPPVLSVMTDATHGVTLTGREPVDAQHPMTVSLINPKSSVSGGPTDIIDITVSASSGTETFRGVSLADGGVSLEQILGTKDTPVSSLVTVAAAGANYPSAWPGALAPTPLIDAATAATAPPFSTYHAADFAAAFADDSALDKVAVFNLLLTPGIWDNGVVGQALAMCERKRAFMVLDPPAEAVADQTNSPRPLMADIMTDATTTTIPKSQNGAVYFPYLRCTNPSGVQISLPPSGFVAGVIAREDNNRGVWKAPAGYEALVTTTTGVVDSGRMTDPRHGTLNKVGVNCLRQFPGVGTVVFGARTLVSANPAFEQYKYVPVRRMALFLEQSLYASLKWAIHEPNDAPLWVSIRTTVENFLLGLFKQGALQGSTPSQAFQVICDATTTTPDDQAQGIVNIVVAFAPLKPAEFVIVKLAQLAGQTQS
ncbi:phage tail sheath family protein [Mycobacterium sp.]|uniref:phage tail sheath family protein n=1 Tax=Mycobacterium sp. TaxID=1785 RepID=UPI003D0B6189